MSRLFIYCVAMGLIAAPASGNPLFELQQAIEDAQRAIQDTIEDSIESLRDDLADRDARVPDPCLIAASVARRRDSTVRTSPQFRRFLDQQAVWWAQACKDRAPAESETSRLRALADKLYNSATPKTR